MINKAFKKFILYLQIVIIVIFSLTGCLEKDKSTKLKSNNVIPNGFGVSMHGDLSKQDIQRMRAAKIKWVRIDVTWQEIETKKGHYNFERYDKLNDTLKKNNLRPYYILDYSNRLYEKRTSILTEKGRNAFSNYVKAVVQRYKNQNGVWEIWNEPNHKSYWNDQPSYKDYSLLVEKVAPLIKRYDKSGLVVAPALSGTHTEALQWLENVFKNPKAISSIDAISVHPYNNIRPETVLEDYKKLRNLIKKYSNEPLPIFSGEWGFAVNTYSENFIIDEQKQAEFLVRMLLLNASQNIPVSIWYDWRNDGENPNSKEHNFGLLTNDYQPKLSYYAYANLTKLLNGYSFNKRITSNINQNDFIFEFIDKNENKIIIFWSTNANHSLTLSIPSGEGKFVTLYGKEKKVNWTHNQIEFQISTTPTYLVIKK
ncbi:GH39 family glycosyl hydrolase [Priestia megaterium]|uniref:GH39 family glycosyl hydrolase n=1 Tax=Priestia megaterium TaxID=1404 RepID=UPI0027313A2A|nr:beta-galactosidase [Priestia megaterium]MDP1443105.1 beta-galactosidase [Priestia megaterium]MDP1472229.1 beta-galactosidase [Priestia megaterium]